MKKNTYYIAFLLVVQAIFNSTQAAEIPEEVAPIQGMETGVVKKISIEKLPPAVKKIAQDDLEKNSIGKNRQLGNIPDDAIFYKKNYHANIKDVKDILKNLTFKEANLSSTELSTYAIEKERIQKDQRKMDLGVASLEYLSVQMESSLCFMNGTILATVVQLYS